MDDVATDQLTSALMRRFAATLDRETPDSQTPQGIHWCLCTPETPMEGLGVDGHPRTGAGMPPRRMWASSELVFHAPIPIGSAIERHSREVERIEKDGSTGPLLFVSLEHRVLADGALAVEERQTLVYRQAAIPGETVERRTRPTADGTWQWQRVLHPSCALLFRYSALTFNSHRIHYDRPYATQEEGYPAPVVHGPLIATLLLDLADRELGANRLARFAFRGLAPAFVDEPLTLLGRHEGDGLLFEARGPDGTVMAATATRRPPLSAP